MPRARTQAKIASRKKFALYTSSAREKPRQVIEGTKENGCTYGRFASGGRFLSVDPVVTDAKTGSSFNRYSYAANNPFKYIDPDGREIEILGTPEYVKQVNSDMDMIKSKPEGMALWKGLNDSKQLITIQIPVKLDEGNSTMSEIHADKKPADSAIQYNPADTTGAKDSAGSTTRPGFVGLAHELGHADAAAKGQQSKDFIGNGKTPSTPPGEKQSMKAENAVRVEHGIAKRPDYYQKE